MSAPRNDQGRVRLPKEERGERRTSTFAPPLDGVKDMTDEEFWSRCDEYHESRRHTKRDRGDWRKGQLHIPTRKES